MCERHERQRQREREDFARECKLRQESVNCAVFWFFFFAFFHAACVRGIGPMEEIVDVLHDNQSIDCIYTASLLYTLSRKLYTSYILPLIKMPRNLIYVIHIHVRARCNCRRAMTIIFQFKYQMDFAFLRQRERERR